NQGCVAAHGLPRRACRRPAVRARRYRDSEREPLVLQPGDGNETRDRRRRLDAGGAARRGGESVMTARPLMASGRVVVTEPYVTLQEAKEHLDISHDFRDGFIQSKITAASAIVIGSLNFNLPETPWTAATIPEDIKTATLLVIADLYTERGTTEGREDRPSLSTRVQWLLSPWVVLTVA